MDEITFPFLRLPTELQARIVNRVRQYSDLHALCLVSKHLSEIATPRLYYKVDLTQTNQSWAIEERISILLIKPANLRFVRLLKTPQMTPEDTLLMDRLLPQLRIDFLTEVSFSTHSVKTFPTPRQMTLLWYRQKNLKNLELGSHMVPWLDRFSKKRKPGRTAILKFFTILRITNNIQDARLPYTQLKMHWPLKNLDVSVLQKLTFEAYVVGRPIFLTLNTLFADGRFANLKELSFRYLCNFNQTLTLTKMPALKVLVVYFCTSQGPSVPLILAEDIRLSSLTYKDEWDIAMLTPLLAQAKGVEHLFITCRCEVTATAKSQRDLVRAIIMHKDTLRGLKLNETLALDTDLDVRLWDSFIVKSIQIRCRNLVDLSFPFVSSKPVSYYCELIASFPNLESLTIYEDISYDYGLNTFCIIWSGDSALKLFSASTRLQSIRFKDDSYEGGRSFLRKELVKL